MQVTADVGQVAGAGRQTSSPATVPSKKQAKEEEERLTRELQLVTQERNELRDHLIYVTEGAMNKRPYYTPNPLYEKLKLKEKEIMTFLHTLEKENIEAKQNFQDLKKEINFYHNLHSRLLMQKNFMNKRLVILKQENKEVHADWTIIQQYLIDLNLIDKDEEEKPSILQDLQHQASAAPHWEPQAMDTPQLAQPSLTTLCPARLSLRLCPPSPLLPRGFHSPGQLRGGEEGED
ncbi:disks large homolog 5-like [Apodemus sylvaticus]|uniref:disks large homolog 5-like n=1 Tax=Apodemus sylvaticus TaxID=10129 RepID=UPI002242CB3E|nr:disks large homolog 5-like [Apodemus sylvaticus]